MFRWSPSRPIFSLDEMRACDFWRHKERIKRVKLIVKWHWRHAALVVLVYYSVGSSFMVVVYQRYLVEWYLWCCGIYMSVCFFRGWNPQNVVLVTQRYAFLMQHEKFLSAPNGNIIHRKNSSDVQCGYLSWQSTCRSATCHAIGYQCLSVIEQLF